MRAQSWFTTPHYSCWKPCACVCHYSSHVSLLESLVMTRVICHDSSQHAVESESSQSHFTGDSSQVEVKSFRWNIESSQVKSSQKLWLESTGVRVSHLTWYNTGTCICTCPFAWRPGRFYRFMDEPTPEAYFCLSFFLGEREINVCSCYREQTELSGFSAQICIRA